MMGTDYKGRKQGLLYAVQASESQACITETQLSLDPLESDLLLLASPTSEAHVQLCG